MAATVEGLAQAGYPVQRINVNRQPELARRYAVSAIPCCIVVERGREIDRVTGVTTMERLKLRLRPGFPSPIRDPRFLSPVPHPAWRYERPIGYRAAVVENFAAAPVPLAQPVPPSLAQPEPPRFERLAAACWSVGTAASSS